MFSWFRVSNVYLYCHHVIRREVTLGILVGFVPLLVCVTVHAMQSTMVANGAYCVINFAGDLFFKRSHTTGQCSMFDLCKLNPMLPCSAKVILMLLSNVLKLYDLKLMFPKSNRRNFLVPPK